MRRDFQAFFAAFSDPDSKVENLMADGNWAVWEWLGTGTFTGPFLGQPPTGRSCALHGCGFFQIRDGKIVFQRGYWDKQTWFAQVGLKSVV